MLDVAAIARCSRCNVISLPIHPFRSDPTHATIVLPSDWMGVRLFLDGEEEFILCPDCRSEAWDWLTTRVVRKPSSDNWCNAVYYPENADRMFRGDFCMKPKNHAGEHGTGF